MRFYNENHKTITKHDPKQEGGGGGKCAATVQT